MMMMMPADVQCHLVPPMLYVGPYVVDLCSKFNVPILSLSRSVRDLPLKLLDRGQGQGPQRCRFPLSVSGLSRLFRPLNPMALNEFPRHTNLRGSLNHCQATFLIIIPPKCAPSSPPHVLRSGKTATLHISQHEAALFPTSNF